MKMEWTAEVLRGWPQDGARERSEQIRQGAVLINGDIVTPQLDGTVDKVGATVSKAVGLVVRGNGDSASAANANGVFMTPQPAKAITALTWAAGVVTATVTGHGYVTGNIVEITTGTPADNGVVAITVVDANTFTYKQAVATVATSGTSTLKSTMNNTGKAVVLWGNFIVRTSNYDKTAVYTPGVFVTGKDGKYTLAGSTDPVVGFVLSVQGASATSTQSIVVSVY